MNVLLQAIVTLLGLIVAGIAAVENAVRGLLAGTGISPQAESIVMLAVAVLLILAAFRLFGGIFAVLCTVFLLLVMVHILAPGVLDGLHHA